jgi:SagB-type dehydrogenase family enzyme
MTTKFIVLLSPLGLWLLWLLLPLARGRVIPRSRLTIGLSLLVLVYFLAVAGTGIFWVAVQELPIFDWHYLPGYILAILTITHVVLHWRNVTAFLRRAAPAALAEPGGAHFRRGIRAGAWCLFVLAGATLVFFIGERSGSVSVVYSGQPLTADPVERSGGVLVPPVLIESGDRRMSLARFYHEGSSCPARTRLPGLTIGSRPDVYKDFPGERIPLPEFRDPDTMQVFSAFQTWRAGSASADTASISREQLAELLYCAEGFSKTVKFHLESIDLRTAPSAGALYPVNLYLVVGRGGGLQPGIYYHHPKEHSLIQVRQDDSALRNLSVGAANPGAWARTEVAVVLTVTFSRTAFKYTERAYRYVCLDAGHIAGNLALCAAAQGRRTPLIARFDDRAVNAVLDLDPSVEAALLLMPVMRGAREAVEPRFEHDESIIIHGSFVDLIHGGTSLRRAGAQGDYVPRAPAFTPSQPEDTVLPDPASGIGLIAAIRQRRSVRNYTSAPITLSELSSLCLAAAGEQPGVVTADPLLADSAPLGFYVVARDVTGLEAGIYRYLPRTHALRPLRSGDFSRACMQTCEQQEFCATADAIFVMTVRWDDLYVPDGDRGYRYAHLRAGVAGEGLYLQGCALGIGACAVGAFQDPDLAAIIGLDLEEEVPLYVTAVGR